ncbi:GNAT family N-acetyltransferase [Neobacillus kokaensis]|uniref:N-acetyltransferase n=1 Tax=Neobacillus kokaensis TaxID=2759023 RepID=A0ABQ3MWW8_9BACI|nr:GNAT family N-acetyltransferase [Neobacillus kokaensis]GHH96744.1 N-acetyltransferase [Neobacillus kokaensis]
MIKTLDLQDNSLLKNLFKLQKASYLIEAKLINFYKIPPLVETIDDLKNCSEKFYGYFEEKGLTGALSFTLDGEKLTICRLVVDPKHFRKGIAQKLLSAVEKNYPEIRVVKVATGKDNLPAKNLYLKNGYRLKRELEVTAGLYMCFFEKNLKK